MTDRYPSLVNVSIVSRCATATHVETIAEDLRHLTMGIDRSMDMLGQAAGGINRSLQAAQRGGFTAMTASCTRSTRRSARAALRWPAP
jgi:hypothetical protein